VLDGKQVTMFGNNVFKSGSRPLL